MPDRRFLPRVAAWGLSLALLVGGAPGVAARDQPSRRELARAGTVTIDERDLELRQAMLHARGAEVVDPARALVELLGEALEAEVARQEDAAPTAADLSAVDRHAVANSRAPEVLAAIREIFAADRERFARQVLAPPVVHSRLRARFSASPSEHRAARQSIERAYALVAAGASLEEAAKEVGGERRTWSLGEADAPVEEMLATGARFGEDPLLPIVAALGDGHIYDRIVEGDDALLVVRRLRAGQGGAVAVEAVAVAKGSYEPWYRARAERVALTIADPELRSAACARYGSAWYLAGVCGDRTTR